MTDTQTPDSLRPGDIVGPWRVEGYAGRGTSGVVYRARRAGHPNSMPVALKIAVFPSDPRFNREVALLHQNECLHRDVKGHNILFESELPSRSMIPRG